MTDPMDVLFQGLSQELSKDVPDEGFSQAVMGRIERPRTIRRALTGVIIGLSAWLLFGPVAELMVLVSAQVSQFMRVVDPAWVTQNQIAVIVVLAAIAFLPLMSLLEE
jgi:hypothetical protein